MLKIQIGNGAVVPFEFSVTAEKFCGEDFFDNGKFTGEIKIVGEVLDDEENLKVRGKIFCRKEFTCDRCLSDAAENQVHEFDEELDDAEVIDGFVDITELVRDVMIASQPIQNLCKIDCKGLCPNCGKNLNEGDCGCDRFIPDPRLAILQELDVSS